MTQMAITKTCEFCDQLFIVDDEDLEFYKKIDVPAPTFCPDCRQQRRLTYRNERKFYKRKCDFSGKEIVSVYSPDKKCKVYSQEAFWSDDWDAMKYGRDFDFNKPFFEQFDELSLEVPRPCTIGFSSENSVYTNHSAYNKNCYMCINTGWCEDMFYCTNYSIWSKNCADCLAIQKCELCYYCTDVKKSYQSSFLHECMDCTDCNFCYDCNSCQNCYMCFNLRRQQYCIENKKYSKEEYERKIKELMPKTTKEYRSAFGRFKQIVGEKAIHKASIITQCENSTGGHLFNSKNLKRSYFVFDSEDCSYCYDCGEIKNCVDTFEPFQGELQYETHGCNKGYNLIVDSKCYTNNNLSYCQYCWNSAYLFGCFGLKRKQYCVFNKQYSKEEYEILTKKIIAHMKTTGEWGEFFPAKFSPFGYNETSGQDYCPLTKEQALAKGFNWKDEDKKDYLPQTYSVPEFIKDVPESIIKEILQCKTCGKNFKVIIQELEFYKQNLLPIPEMCPDCRHAERVALRNPRKLWDRNCSKCGIAVKSVYDPQRPESIYCEKCYLESVY